LTFGKIIQTNQSNTPPFTFKRLTPKITQYSTPTYLFNVTKISFGKFRIPGDYTPYKETPDELIDCVWIYNATDTDGVAITEPKAISEVRQKLEEMNSEFLVIESEVVCDRLRPQ
jgi:hypothetical protein